VWLILDDFTVVSSETHKQTLVKHVKPTLTDMEIDLLRVCYTPLIPLLLSVLALSHMHKKGWYPLPTPQSTKPGDFAQVMPISCLQHPEVSIKSAADNETYRQNHAGSLGIRSSFEGCREGRGAFRYANRKAKITTVREGRESLKPKLTCETCGKIFGTKQSLKEHYGRHSGEKFYTCEWCNASYRYRSTLWRHLNRRRNLCNATYYSFETGNNIQMTPSQWGGRRFGKIGGTDTWRKIVNCSVCTRPYQLRNLKMHFRVHSGERPFECQDCKARFTQQVALKRHMASHRSISSME